MDPRRLPAGMTELEEEGGPMTTVGRAIADSFDGIMVHSALRHFFVVIIPR
jgi:hypothetical protein